MSPATLLAILASFLLYLATYAIALGLLGLASRKFAALLGVDFNGKVSYLALLLLGAGGLLPLTVLTGADATHLAIGAGAFVAVGALLWKLIGFGPGWFFELVLLATRPSRDMWKIERIRHGSGPARKRKRWVTRDQGEVENAIKVGGFWAVFCTAVDVAAARYVFEIANSSGEFLFGVICVFLLYLFVFAGGAVQQPAVAEE